METLKIMNLAKEDCKTGDARILSDLIAAFAKRESKDKTDEQKKVENLIKKFIAFCSVLPQACDLLPNTMREHSPDDDGAIDGQEQ